jgi:hypothetical protein
MAVVGSVLVILGCSLVTCAPESGPQLTWLVVFLLTTDFICFCLLLSSVSVDLEENALSGVQFPLLSFWPNNTSVASDVTMGFLLQRSSSESLLRESLFIIGYQGYSSFRGRFRRTVTIFTHSIITGIIVLFEDQIIVRLVKISVSFYWTQMLIPCTQESANVFRPEPDKYSPYIHNVTDLINALPDNSPVNTVHCQVIRQ